MIDMDKEYKCNVVKKNNNSAQEFKQITYKRVCINIHGNSITLLANPLLDDKKGQLQNY